MRFAFANLLASVVPPSKNKLKNKKIVMIAQATKTAIAVLVAGKFEILGSNFSHETEGLLASDAIHNNFLFFYSTTQIRNE